MIWRVTGTRSCGQMRQKFSYLASTHLMKKGEMLPMTTRTLSSLSSVDVETLCFGVFFCIVLLQWVNGWMDGAMCHQLLGANLLPSAKWFKWVVDGSSNKIMTQNAQPWQQKVWLKKNYIKVIEWPSHCPDLNRIENLQRQLELRVDKQEPPEPNDLEVICKERIPPDMSRNLIISYKKRLTLIIRVLTRFPSMKFSKGSNTYSLYCISGYMNGKSLWWCFSLVTGILGCVCVYEGVTY